VIQIEPFKIENFVFTLPQPEFAEFAEPIKKEGKEKIPRMTLFTTASN
jgi:hypothetical protein